MVAGASLGRKKKEIARNALLRGTTGARGQDARGRTVSLQENYAPFIPPSYVSNAVRVGRNRLVYLINRFDC